MVKKMQIVAQGTRTRGNWTQGQRMARAQAIMRVLKAASVPGDHDHIQCPHCAGWVAWDCVEAPNGRPVVSGHCATDNGCWSFVA